MDEKEALIQLYHESAENYRHHTTLAWAIGAILVPVALYILYLSFVNNVMIEKASLGIFGIFILFVWHVAYDRLGYSAKIEGDNLIDIEKKLKLRVKPHDRFKSDLNRITLEDLLCGFGGFGKFVSFWFIRWLFISVYSFGCVYIWNLNNSHSINFMVFPIPILFILNLMDLRYISYKNQIRNKRPIFKFFGENLKLMMVFFSIVWFFGGGIILHLTGMSLNILLIMLQ